MQSGFAYYSEAYKVFQNMNDTLFMLLTSKLIIELCRSKGYTKDYYKDFQSIYESITRLPEFKDVNLDLLFENFDQRLQLARQVLVSYPRSLMDFITLRLRSRTTSLRAVPVLEGRESWTWPTLKST